MVSPQITQSDMTRVWIIPNTASPSRAAVYEGLAMADRPEEDFGTPTPIFIPDPGRYQQFILAGKVGGDRQLPTLQLNWFYILDKQSVLDRYVKSRCAHDIQIHMGLCANPQDFNRGWEKIYVLEGAQPTRWSPTSLGALTPDQRASVQEEVPFTGDRGYHIYPMQYQEEATTEIVQEIIAVDICDSVQCGACGIVSNGCAKVFALTLTAGGSPGLSAELIFTDDGGLTWQEANITTLAANEDPDDMECVSVNMVVISEDSESIHYAPLADILEGIETWIEVTTGFVAGNGPLAIHSQGPCLTWIVAANGFIYFTNDPTVGVTEVQDAGVATVQNLNAIHGFDSNHLVTVGDSNAVVVTTNGGVTWSAITGPSVGVNLNTVFMRGQLEWFIGDAGGQLWYTLDGGVNWIEKVFPGSGTGVVRDIKFSSKSVGFMSHDTVAPLGRVLRTIDGGNTWFVEALNNLPVPANDRFNALAVCSEDVNLVYAGGLGDDAIDGILVGGSGPVGP